MDVAKSGGLGTTNDGNTARVAFQNHEKLAVILGINPDLLMKLYIILSALSRQEAVDPHRFQVFCREAAELKVSLYSWYPMPASCYKILVHGHQAMRELPVPAGLLAEEKNARRNPTRYLSSPGNT